MMRPFAVAAMLAVGCANHSGATGSDGGDAGGGDLGNDGGGVGNSTCSVTTATASASVVASAPSIAFSDSVWGIVWADPSGGVMFNAVDPNVAQPLQHPSDVLVVGPMPPQTWAFRDAHIATTGNQFAVAYGFSVTYGSPTMHAAGPGAAIVTPSTGAVASHSETGMLNEGVPPYVGAAAVRSTGPVVGVAYRSAAMTPSAVSDAVFNGVPAMTSGGSRSALAGSVSIGFAPGADRFAVTFLTDASASGGTALIEDAMRSSVSSQTFTGPGDSPIVDGGVAVVGNADRFAVAWTDAQPCAGCSGSEIFLSVVPTSGPREGEVHVGIASPNPKTFPAVASDGRSYIVAWIEGVGGDNALLMQRFDATTLVSAGAPITVASGGVAQLNFGMAVGAMNDYGIVFSDRGSGKLTFSHVTCTGP